MNDNAKAWINELRSRKYTQGMGLLCSGEKYCCLGVACDLYWNTVGNIAKETHRGYTTYGGEVFSLPLAVQSWLGLSNDSGACPHGSAMSCNDNENMTFVEIADWIERHAESLFITEPVITEPASGVA